MPTPTQLRWGVLATGSIANAFAAAIPHTRQSTLAAVCSRDADRAQAFATKHSIPHAHASLEDFLADDTVDAVYVASPHPMHPEQTLRCLHAGKHVLCEKPIAINAFLADAMFDAAAERGLLLMEAFKDRFYPQTAALLQRVRDGVIGDAQLIEASFAYRVGPDADPTKRHLNPDLAGGGILDVGCYPANLARLIAGAALGLPFANPLHVAGAAHLGDTGVDEYATATLRFDRGLLATLTTGVQLNHPQTLHVHGTNGRIHVPNPWGNDWFNAQSFAFTVHRGDDVIETVETQTDAPPFALEADAFADAVLNGSNAVQHPAMTPDDSLGLAHTLDRWRKAINLRYPSEDPANMPAPLPTQTTTSPNHQIPQATLPHLTKPVSRLIMGCDNQFHSDHARVMFDLYTEHGGNTFDTAVIYGGGAMEKLLGAWMTARGNRDDITLLNKGCHTPWHWPHHMRDQLRVSLDRLQTDRVELYVMHRDNPDVPVGEFIDLLNEWKDQGLVQAFGGSNWTTQRFDEANAYAAANGKQGLTVLNNNLSLARMNNPVWAGCIAASDPDTMDWLTRTHTAHLAWSSQARGFFTDRAGPTQRDDEELVRVWYSDDNFTRRDRALELAATHNVTPINIALAYVLNQSFPSFALIGPRRPIELRTTLPGATLHLTPQELAYLDLRAASPQ